MRNSAKKTSRDVQQQKKVDELNEKLSAEEQAKSVARQYVDIIKAKIFTSVQQSASAGEEATVIIFNVPPEISDTVAMALGDIIVSHLERAGFSATYVYRSGVRELRLVLGW